MKNNRNLFIIAIIALVNAVGYGIIIPVMYTYSKQFGLSDFQNGLLFSLFSVCQFISTPIIGRLSDKYGRKPLLVLSLFGTGISFLMTAFAPFGWVLFVARALDGITAGNIPVALAVISDTTEPKHRAKGFGIIGATFGFGLVLGPAISGLTVQYGSHIPFLVAAGMSFVAVFTTLLFLPETNTHEKEVGKAKLFDFRYLITSLVDPHVGVTLMTSLLFALAHSLYVYAFQPYSVTTLGLSPKEFSYIFMGIGIVGLIAQGGFIGLAVKWVGEKKILSLCFLINCAMFIGMYVSGNIASFVVLVVIQAFFSSFISPIIQTLLSKETDERSQGTMMGLNSSYQSIGTIIGPIIGGGVATLSVHAPFLVVSGISAVLFFLSLSVVHMRINHRLTAFSTR